MMRIIAGKHRSRPLEVPATQEIRPTTDKARGALFSMLQHRLGSWDGVRALDACCGTGAAGLEAISRGAEEAFFIDSDARSLELTRRNVKKLGELEHSKFFLADIQKIGPAPLACHLLLLDPPYNKGIAQNGLARLTANGWADAAAFAAVEVARDEAFDAPPSWHVLTERIHGAARLIILERQS